MWRTPACFVLVVALGLSVALRAEAQLPGVPSASERVVRDATNVLAQTIAMPSGIPQRLLADAQGIVVVPGMLRGAFVVGVQHGRGVLLMRDGQGGWQPPRMIQITGGSFGYQIGVQSTDLILVFRTPQSVTNVLTGTVKLGVDASVAAGPVGRQASAATDLPLQAEILSYSRARGVFAGVSIDGSSITIDATAEASYYQPPGAVPDSAMQLLQVLAAYGTAPRIVAPNGEVEAARQRLDTASRRLAAMLDADWQRYLALPAEVYQPNRVPSPQGIQQSIERYEEVSRRAEYAALADRPEFQETLHALHKLSEIRQATNQPADLPRPPGWTTAR